MSLYAPGTFASQTEKNCATQTGYVFVETMNDPFDTFTNSQAVKTAYQNCLNAAGFSPAPATTFPWGQPQGSPPQNGQTPINSIPTPVKGLLGLAALFIFLKVVKVI